MYLTAAAKISDSMRASHSAAAEIAKFMKLNSAWEDTFKSMSRATAFTDPFKNIASLRSSWEQADQLAKQLRAATDIKIDFGYLDAARQIQKSFEQSQLATRSAFETMLGDLRGQSAATGFASAIEQMRGLTQPGVADWLKGLDKGALDFASSAAIAREWGLGGAAKQLRELGLPDAAGLLRGPPGAAAPSEEVQADGNGEIPAAIIHGISIWNWIAILGVILALAGLAWAEYSGGEMERRLGGKIDDAAEAQRKRDEFIQAFVKQALERSAPVAAGRQLVVRERPALVRAQPKSGSGRVAQIFPNQVVEMVDEDGKWVRVRYFDWIQRAEMEGWALRKYFERIDPRGEAQSQ